ncbi:hypothetical protein CWI39_2275p0010 [Hamiltosporidium magnivora]|uniref:Uncharacterized protein n=1 Tax=Hamiltosporidium magnivora TaxID=148818 RepID=A0A4Q9KWP9_9MICR|nr:hypothetical protein CWI39_2275p0010 [Hamiltosporidium magnivora]
MHLIFNMNMFILSPYKDSVKHLKTKNYTHISNEGHTLDEPTININEESYLEEENI